MVISKPVVGLGDKSHVEHSVYHPLFHYGPNGLWKQISHAMTSHQGRSQTSISTGANSYNNKTYLKYK